MTDRPGDSGCGRDFNLLFFRPVGNRPTKRILNLGPVGKEPTRAKGDAATGAGESLMSDARIGMLTGEFRRVYDDRYRIALPPELADLVAHENEEAVLAKEREGCLSLWKREVWRQKFDGGVELIQKKLELARLEQQTVKIQRLFRLLSTRSRVVKLAARHRLLVPEGFREFLSVEPNSEVMVVGAGLCLEIWNPAAWNAYVKQDIGGFHELLEELIA